MSLETQSSTVQMQNYSPNVAGFKQYLYDLGDQLFPFPSYRQYQDEILYEVLEAFYINGVRNVVVEGPTGIGKSPLNVAVARVNSTLNKQQGDIRSYFGVEIDGLYNGKTFYTTPQKSLRNQLAEDQDLRDYVTMLKSRRDYICGETGDNCGDCSIHFSSEESCMEQMNCTYWNRKMDAINSDIAVITFAMMIVDNHLPVRSDDGRRLSFDHRDLVIVDEGHNSEGQSASMFAGFTLSPWSLPPEVYGEAGRKADWEDDRFEHVEEIVSEIAVRAQQFVTEHEDDPRYASQIEQCEDMLRKIRYCIQTHADGKGWVVNVDEVARREQDGTTKKIEIKPVRVNEFLSEFVWSRGARRLITSATIPFRNNVERWGERIGLDGDITFVSKPTPFPKEHREIYLNTMVGEMNSSNEDDNWPEAMDQIREIHSNHQGEKGLIHSVSYPRAERVAKALPDGDVIIDEQDRETDDVITRWQNSDADILVSPTMTEGVDLHGDMCRWQVLLKAPFAYYGDSRVSYLLNEENDWQWYYEEAGIDIIQSVGRAVRGPEPEEAAAFYIVDEKFEDVMYRTTPPEYFVEAVEDGPPEHWSNPEAAPWR